MTTKAGFIIVGQSLATFWGDSAWGVGGPAVFYSPLSRAFYGAVDPMPGCSTPGASPAAGGSIWSRLGWLMGRAAPPPWDQACFALLAVNGSTSASWTPGQPNYAQIAQAKADLAAAGWPVTAYLNQQGEADAWHGAVGAGTTGDYCGNVLATVGGLRSGGDHAPFFLAFSTTCRQTAGGDGVAYPCGDDYGTLTPAARLARYQQQGQIQAEQRWLCSTYSPLGIYPGANTDLIGPGGRWDGCHLNDLGQWRAAEMWLDVLTRAKSAGLVG